MTNFSQKNYLPEFYSQIKIALSVLMRIVYNDKSGVSKA